MSNLIILNLNDLHGQKVIVRSTEVARVAEGNNTAVAHIYFTDGSSVAVIGNHSEISSALAGSVPRDIETEVFAALTQDITPTPGDSIPEPTVDVPVDPTSIEDAPLADPAEEATIDTTIAETVETSADTDETETIPAEDEATEAEAEAEAEAGEALPETLGEDTDTKPKAKTKSKKAGDTE